MQGERRYMIGILLLLLVNFSWATVSWAVTPERRGLEIAQEGERRDEGWVNSQVDLTMVLRNQRGETSIRHLRSFTLEDTEDGDRSLIIFDSPADVAGSKFLSFSHKQGDDDQWLFLPALKRVKRISSSNKGGSFMGSEFSYEDMTSPVLEKFDYKYLRDDIYKGRPVFVVERYPKDKHSHYSKHVMWIDQKHYIFWKVEYFNRRGDHTKTQTYSKYKRYLGRFWRPGKTVMVNHITKKATALLWKNYQFRNPDINSDMFSPQRLAQDM